LFVAKVISEDSQEVELQVARSGSAKYHFRKVKLPFPLLRQHSYTILDYTARQVFIHVTHSISGITYGNLYKSDSTGSLFTLSSKNNVRNLYGYCDFIRVKGLNGIYIVNSYNDQDLEMARIQLQNANSEEDRNQAILKNMNKRTRISFDKGGLWHSVAPSVRSE
jgi:hypothetical protein